MIDIKVSKTLFASPIKCWGNSQYVQPFPTFLLKVTMSGACEIRIRKCWDVKLGICLQAPQAAQTTHGTTFYPLAHPQFGPRLRSQCQYSMNSIRRSIQVRYIDDCLAALIHAQYFFRSARTSCTTFDWSRPPVRPSALKIWTPCIQAYMPHESLGDSSNQPDGPMGSPRRLP